MSALIVSVVFVLVICVIAYRADTRCYNEARLPMQWGFTGQVNWSAPRRLALAFMPMLAVALLGFFTVMSINVPPRAGQDGLVLPILVVMGITLVGVQLVHFWLIERTIHRNPD